MFTFALLLVLPALILADVLANLEEEVFKAMDTDGDGKVTQPEIEGYFLGYDENKDGFICQLEFKDKVEKADPAFTGLEKGMFQLLDQNADGQVTKGDLDAVFKRVDTDGDNVIERQEFDLAFAALDTLVD